ncbi:CFI-box-CTERM domain-containing protein [Argonema antarcticum]|uniref:CFI-box-CTERM domain-containing protein n=1 Tax=Argonema antarcticum TaxID=2942763 RepID=UPI002011D88D|nr:CFI-box-CTERM domain-containing protein [Argonema antarcticum]MCL1471819.1 hypothetical protein [Argonema antarcticum A004/B2]
MENPMRQAAKSCKESAERFWERAKYYAENRDVQQAFNNYVESLEKYASYVLWNEKAWSVENNISTSEGPTYEFLDRLFFLFDLAARLEKLIDSPRTSGILEIYIAEKYKMIFDEVTKYQNSFSVDQIKNHKVFAENVLYYESQIANNKEALNRIREVDPEKEQDDTLKKIRVALLKISETKICLTTLEKKPGCFIATAAYSTSTHPDLDTFRNFRDEKLLTNPVGKRLVNFYYQISPSIAKYVEKRPAIKSFLRHQLERLAQWMRKDLI